MEQMVPLTLSTIELQVPSYGTVMAPFQNGIAENWRYYDLLHHPSLTSGSTVWTDLDEISGGLAYKIRAITLFYLTISAQSPLVDVFPYRAVQHGLLIVGNGSHPSIDIDHSNLSIIGVAGQPYVADQLLMFAINLANIYQLPVFSRRRHYIAFLPHRCQVLPFIDTLTIGRVPTGSRLERTLTILAIGRIPVADFCQLEQALAVLPEFTTPQKEKFRYHTGRLFTKRCCMYLCQMFNFCLIFLILTLSWILRSRLMKYTEKYIILGTIKLRD
ncbi:hypothetical protein LAZ67_15001045 [Cordylochernes scorpioides]|uniref:Uncharacterized protein n=1 Tax=Cordylochernes scorpioides TaxID=51811 RepID=A0ABY6LB12_9ARAC|nr:hypothetical protein LAZ67_15001045 [Cordylochernes scorpioides]